MMRIPISTYRLQFSPDFRFQDARDLVPYLSDLGISDIYASPILRATQGSTHGYDVSNPDELNPELGTLEDFQSLADEVQAHQMGWVQDIVPNHMAYSSGNWMLMDLFEKGAHSSFYGFFDIFWDHPDASLQTKVLAPFLSCSLVEALRQGQIRLALDREGLAIRYGDWRFPLYLASYESVLGSDKTQRLAELRDTFVQLSQMDDCAKMRRQLEEAKETLARLYEGDPEIHESIDGLMEAFNPLVDGAVEQSPLYRLLEQQLFYLVPWQVASEKINYRRFFYVNDFIALHIENPQVFNRIHHTTFELARADLFTGLRIDHVDGLYNPRAYLVQLRDVLRDCYIVVEKILELYEFLPAEWPIQGTCGYKFCNCLNGIFCHTENAPAFTRIYHEFISAEPDYSERLFTEKENILREHMAGEVTYLAHLAMQASADENLTLESARRALIALMAAFPVYRTYIDATHVTQQDRVLFAEAVRKAVDRYPQHREDIDCVAKLLQNVSAQTEAAPNLEPLDLKRQTFLMRFQQFTGPAMAKGFEDTLLYVYNRFISLNEVGGDPFTFGLPLDRFHRFNESVAQRWPHTMNTTSTHDSKRGEDIRARLNVLSEIPNRWQEAVNHWADMNERHKLRLGDRSVPDRNDEYLLYQTLVGVLPFEPETQNLAFLKQRISEYMVKALREGKVNSSWIRPNEAYENACLQFIDRILDGSTENRFWSDFVTFQKDIAEYGIYNSLSQTLLKITSPGLPDFYQGTELWDLNLVDPDNRRAVDFAKRASLLAQLQNETPTWHGLIENRYDGRIKLFLIRKVLHTRAENRDLFEEGDYVPGSVTGSRAEHVVAFFRTRPDRQALIVAPRFLTSLTQPGQPPIGRDVWRDTRIPLPASSPSTWQDGITGNEVTAQAELAVGDILREFPVALLLGH
jgi:(1->4)-alpha-D-glucan 1-alpha-D-glucosylmutase